jgi:hypothetical protein
MREVAEFKRQNVVVRQHKRFDVVPPDRYSGETFSLLIGGRRHRTRVLDNDETEPDGAQIEHVPIEHIDEFRRHPERALQSIIGMAVESITPFIGRRETIIDAFEDGADLEQWVDLPDVILEEDGLPRWLEDVIPENPQAPRFIHIDLSHTGDTCGIAIVRSMGLVNLAGAAIAEVIEARPAFRVEAAISIQPSPQAELDFAQLRRWLMNLTTKFNVQIHTVSFDGYQSVEMRQVFRTAGIRTKLISLDRSAEPYNYLRDCLYEDRITIVESNTLLNELVELEWDQRNNKDDHPPHGSKDVADAVCGAVWLAAWSREQRNGGGFMDEAGEFIRLPRQRPQGNNRPPGYRRSQRPPRG